MHTMIAALDSSELGSTQRQAALAQVAGHLQVLAGLRAAAAELQAEASALVPPVVDPNAFEQVGW
jgi:hypothetical protein